MAAPGKPLLTIEKTSSYKVLAQVPQEELAGIRPGSKVFITNGDNTLQTKVNRIYPSLGKNLMATVEVLTPSAPFKLPSYSTVGFDIVTRKVEGLILPEQGVVKSEHGTFVYLIKDGVVHIKRVKLLGLGNGKAAVSGDIAPGEQVAVGQENKLLTLTEGSRVATSEANKPTTGKPATKGER
jgi:hypothetical protein